MSCTDIKGVGGVEGVGGGVEVDFGERGCMRVEWSINCIGGGGGGGGGRLSKGSGSEVSVEGD